MFSAGGGDEHHRGFAKGEPSVAGGIPPRPVDRPGPDPVLLLFAADRLRNGETVAAALAIAAVAFPALCAASSLYGPIPVGQERIGRVAARDRKQPGLRRPLLRGDRHTTVLIRSSAPTRL